MIDWKKIDHFTGEPYIKNAKSGSWFVVDYISGDMKIVTLADGSRELVINGQSVAIFKTLKAAKSYAESLQMKGIRK